MPTAVLTIKGFIPSKKNQYKAGRGRIYIPEDVKVRLLDIESQLRRQWHPRARVRHPNVLYRLVTHTDRQDKDNMVTTVLDCMKKAGVIVDDSIKEHNGWATTAPALLHGGPVEDDRMFIHMHWSGEEADGEAIAA